MLITAAKEEMHEETQVLTHVSTTIPISSASLAFHPGRRKLARELSYLLTSLPPWNKKSKPDEADWDHLKQVVQVAGTCDPFFLVDASH